MAIRPTDLQNSIVQSIQNQPIGQRAEDAPGRAQAAAQQAFVAQTAQRSETVAETGNMSGNRIEVGDRPQDRQERKGAKHKRNPNDPFEEVVEDAAGFDEPPHLIDFTA